MFKDRAHAGRILAKALAGYAQTYPLVLAIPRGGVQVAFHVAKILNAQLSIIIVRKLPFPDNAEAGFGAVAEDGSLVILPQAANRLSQETINSVIDEQTIEVKRRVAVLRNSRPLPQIEGKTIILVDDGIAMGSTMQAAVKLCRNQNAKKIIVAAPVASSQTAAIFRTLADEVFILETPAMFRAVADAYENWYDVPDSEVLNILKLFNERT